MKKLRSQSGLRSNGQAEKGLLAEINRHGGDERARGAQGALKVFESSLLDLVKENPAAYGAGTDAESQKKVVNELFQSVSTSFLARTVQDIRRKQGYVLVLGRWVHRAVFTFVGFGLLAALVLPLCAVSLMSTRAWGWVPGAIGLVGALAVGAWILTRIRNR